MKSMRTPVSLSRSFSSIGIIYNGQCPDFLGHLVRGQRHGSMLVSTHLNALRWSFVFPINIGIS